MLSRREFLAGGIALLAGCSMGPLPEHDPSAHESIDEIVQASAAYFARKEYDDARYYLGKYGKQKSVTINGKRRDVMEFDNPTIEFLYAMSLIPGDMIANALNGKYWMASHHLEEVMGKIHKTPLALEDMQNQLNPFFAIPEYAAYKKLCNEKMKGKHAMFYVLLTLAEEDYQEAAKGLDTAAPRLEPYEKTKVHTTLTQLMLRAQERANACVAAPDEETRGLSGLYFQRAQAYGALAELVK